MIKTPLQVGIVLHSYTYSTAHNGFEKKVSYAFHVKEFGLGMPETCSTIHPSTEEMTKNFGKLVVIFTQCWE